MLKDKLEQFLKNRGTIFNTEKEYALRTGLLNGQEYPTEGDDSKRFLDAYIELGDKETEELIAVKGAEFLDTPLSYFSEHKNEFMYLESEWWKLIGVDAVSLELDDVFGNFDVMLGIMLQKKHKPAIEGYLAENLGDYDLMFDGNEGIWSLNFSLNDLQGFDSGMTVGTAYTIIYQFLFGLAESIENKQ